LFDEAIASVLSQEKANLEALPSGSKGVLAANQWQTNLLMATTGITSVYDQVRALQREAAAKRGRDLAADQLS
jgi:hypothetical protein